MTKWKSVPIYIVLCHSNPEDQSIVSARRNKRWAEKAAEHLQEVTGYYHSVVETNLLEERHL
jgi:hypothetical protein